MSISLTTGNQIFDNDKNLIIVFNAYSGEITSKIKENYVFIYGENQELIGINIFDYKKDFKSIKKGYHVFSNKNFMKIVKKFPDEMKFIENNSFFAVGIINKIENHPKSSKLKVLYIETKNRGKIQIITNISNLNIGDKYLFALDNAFLGNGLVIKESQIMGIKSQGMLCSYKSIGVDKEGVILIKNQDEDEHFVF